MNARQRFRHECHSMMMLCFILDFWAENAMLNIGKFEKAFGNFLGAFPYGWAEKDLCGGRIYKWRKNFILFFTVRWRSFC